MSKRKMTVDLDSTDEKRSLYAFGVNLLCLDGIVMDRIRSLLSFFALITLEQVSSWMSVHRNGRLTRKLLFTIEAGTDHLTLTVKKSHSGKNAEQREIQRENLFFALTAAFARLRTISGISTPTNLRECAKNALLVAQITTVRRLSMIVPNGRAIMNGDFALLRFCAPHLKRLSFIEDGQKVDPFAMLNYLPDCLELCTQLRRLSLINCEGRYVRNINQLQQLTKSIRCLPRLRHFDLPLHSYRATFHGVVTTEILKAFDQRPLKHLTLGVQNLSCLFPPFNDPLLSKLESFHVMFSKASTIDFHERAWPSVQHQMRIVCSRLSKEARIIAHQSLAVESDFEFQSRLAADSDAKRKSNVETALNMWLSLSNDIGRPIFAQCNQRTDAAMAEFQTVLRQTGDRLKAKSEFSNSLRIKEHPNDYEISFEWLNAKVVVSYGERSSRFADLENNKYVLPEN